MENPTEYRYPRATYKYNEFLLHTLTHRKAVVFLCITHQSFSQAAAFSFLQELLIQFSSDFKKQIDNFIERNVGPLRFEMNKAFQQFMQHTIRRYSGTIDDEMLLGIEVLNDANLEDRQIHYKELDSQTIRRMKTTLIIQSSSEYSKLGTLYSGTAKEGVFAGWLLKHPYVSIGFCLFIGVLILLYFVVIVPICGSELQKKNAQGKPICRF